jgi:hypothetical protein
VLLLCVVALSCAAWLPDEPPHPAASKAKPTVVSSAATVRAHRGSQPFLISP